MTEKCADCGKEEVYDYLRPPFALPQDTESGFCKKCFEERVGDFWIKKLVRPISRKREMKSG